MNETFAVVATVDAMWLNVVWQTMMTFVVPLMFLFYIAYVKQPNEAEVKQLKENRDVMYIVGMLCTVAITMTFMIHQFGSVAYTKERLDGTMVFSMAGMLSMFLLLDMSIIRNTIDHGLTVFIIGWSLWILFEAAGSADVLRMITKTMASETDEFVATTKYVSRVHETMFFAILGNTVFVVLELFTLVMNMSNSCLRGACVPAKKNTETMMPAFERTRVRSWLMFCMAIMNIHYMVWTTILSKFTGPIPESAKNDETMRDDRLLRNALGFFAQKSFLVASMYIVALLHMYMFPEDEDEENNKTNLEEPLLKRDPEMGEGEPAERGDMMARIAMQQFQ